LLFDLEKTSNFYERSGILVNPSLFSLSKSPMFQSKSVPYLKHLWHYTSHVGRLPPTAQRGFAGSMKYTLPRTKRVHDSLLERTYVDLGYEYKSGYRPTLPFQREGERMKDEDFERIMSAAYSNKNRYSRPLFPEQDHPAFMQHWEEAYTLTFKRYVNALDGARSMQLSAVVLELDMAKSCGSPWRKFFHSKKEFFQTPSKLPGFEPYAVLEDFNTSLDSENTAFYSFWLDKLKDEIRPNVKVDANKIRTFNCAPIEMVCAMNRLCLEMNQQFYMEGASLNNWSTVGSSKYLGTWDRLIRKHQEVGRNHSYSSDGGQWDSRMMAFLLWVVQHLRSQWCDLTPVEHRRLKMLYRLMIYRIVHGEAGDLMWFFIGNPSGSTNTITDNTIGHTFLWNMAWVLLRDIENRKRTLDDQIPGTQAFQDKNFCLSLCGDDSLITISETILSWFNATAVLQMMASWGTLQEFESVTPRPVEDCVYTSCTSQLYDGVYLPRPDTDRVLAGAIEAGKAHPSYVDGESQLTDPRWTLLRLYAIRIESWGNVDCRRLLSGLIHAWRLRYRQLFSTTPSSFEIHAGVRWGEVATIYKTDSELLWLYTGRETGSNGKSTSFPFVFVDKAMTPIQEQFYRVRQEFDSTLGYPGEGPPKSLETKKAAVVNSERVRNPNTYYMRRARTKIEEGKCVYKNCSSCYSFQFCASRQEMIPVTDCDCDSPLRTCVNHREEATMFGVLIFGVGDVCDRNPGEMSSVGSLLEAQADMAGANMRLMLGDGKDPVKRQKLESNRFGEASNPGPFTDQLAKMQFKYHGNWGGPRYSGGKFTDMPDWTIPALDSLDELFKKHDRDYGTMNQNQADRLFLQRARSLPQSAKKWLAQAGFHVKALNITDVQPAWSKRKVIDREQYPWEEKAMIDTMDPEVMAAFASNGTPLLADEFSPAGNHKGDGPPKSSMKQKKKRSKKVRVRSKKASRKRASQKKFKQKARARNSRRPQVPITSLVRAVQRSQKLSMGSGGTVSFSGTIVLADLESISGSSVRFSSLLSVFANSDTTGLGLPTPQFFDLTPYSLQFLGQQFGIQTSIAVIANFFEKWKGSFVFEWRPACPTTQSGQMTWWVDKDPSDKDQAWLTSQAVLQVAEQHGAKMSSFYEKCSLATGTKEWLWCRQTASTDVRKTSAGHFFAVSNAALNADDTPVLGTLLVRYNIQFSQSCAKEVSYNAQFTGSAINFGTSNAHVPFGSYSSEGKTECKPVQPLSNTVVPYLADTMVSSAFAGDVNGTLVLNHGFVTPCATFVQIHCYAAGAQDADPSISYYLGGVLQAQGYTVQVDSTCHDATDSIGVWTVFIPGGTPPDSAQVTITLNYTAAATYAVNVWTLESQLFEGDFTTTFSTLNYKQVMQQSRRLLATGQKQIADHEVDDDTVSVASRSSMKTRMQDLDWDEKQGRFLPKKASSMK